MPNDSKKILSQSDRLKQCLQSVRITAPDGSKRDIISLGMVKSIQHADHILTCVIEVQSDDFDREAIRRDIHQALAKTTSDTIKILFTVNQALVQKPSPAGRPPPPNPKPIDGIDHVLAVGSGKGGVGKSTLAVQLALALAKTNQAVGLLDADIYGPSIPTMLGLKGKPEVNASKKLIPPQAYGLKAMSMGLLIDIDTPAIWRGPMVMRALDHMLRLSDWGELDILIVDLPPGTGDIPLSLAQKTALSGVIMVSTPQDVALADVAKALAMFHRLEVPITGLVENMQALACPHCGKESRIFTGDGLHRLARQYQVPILGSIPIDPKLAQSLDKGQPLPCSTAKIFADIGAKVQASLPKKSS